MPIYEGLTPAEKFIYEAGYARAIQDVMQLIASLERHPTDTSTTPRVHVSTEHRVRVTEMLSDMTEEERKARLYENLERLRSMSDERDERDAAEAEDG